jgi:adenosylcobinamide-phosphate synthase
LADEANGVYCALKENNLTLAKKRLSMLVSRDTANMDRQQIIRGTIETVAENTVDGILSPMFYLFIGGLPGVWIYKTVNTLDAMVGYKDEAYKELGWASAKIDDILNYIPARISGWIIIPVAGLLCCLNMKQAILTVLCDASKHPSPNSGYPEAAFAGALNIQLGGISYYHGKPQMKPVIGKSYQEVEMEHIKLAIWLMYTTSGLGLIIGCACWIILKIVTQGL